jgi:[ribosomal protein S5]-alanine N-acetyltransferase
LAVSRLVAIVTERLQLRLFSPDELLALREGEAEFLAMTGLMGGGALRVFLISDEVSPAWLEQLRATIEADPWVHGFGVIERASGTLLGTAGFKGPPDADGVVEIAYGIAPSHEGHGYATEAARGLIEFASADSRIRRIRAHTLPERNASASILGKCGFEFIGAVEDPEDGLVWRWERDPES